MKTYSTKSAAKKGAVRANVELSHAEFLKNDEGRWYWEESVPAPIVADPLAVDDTEEAIAVPETSDAYTVGGFAQCPHCGTDVDNGVSDNVEQYEAVRDGSYIVDNKGQWLADMEREAHKQFNCLACGEDFGPAIKLGGLKIEKDRPEQNGITRPSIGGKCREIWDACDEFRATVGSSPMPKQIKDIANQRGWNENNAVIEMYQWRKFNGIVGRQG